MAAQPEPPRDVPLQEKELADLSPTPISPYGKKALKILPDKSRHAETENYFILHFRPETPWLEN